MEGGASIAIRLLQRLFGPLAVETQEHIRALPMETPEELGDALLEFASPNDLQSWLEAHPGRLM